MSFDRDGAQFFPGILSAAEVETLRQAADHVLSQTAGARVWESAAVAEVAHGVAGDIARRLIGDAAKPVRAVFFDKTHEANWLVSWHQDRTIVVEQRIEVPGFGPWSVKQGLVHVAPPQAILDGMATLRVHLDACGPQNSPLVVAVGSHRLGKVAATDAAARASETPQLTCLAEVGDIWAYSTSILHSSTKAAMPARRRVLQLDYASVQLPGGLRWKGLAA